MRQPETNHIKRKPVPESDKPQVKMLEERLAQINWRVFVRVYLVALGLMLLSIFSVILVVGIAKGIVSVMV